MAASVRALSFLFAAAAALASGCGGSDDDVAAAPPPPPVPAPGSAAECFPTLSAVAGTTYQLNYAVSGGLTGTSSTSGAAGPGTFNGVNNLVSQVQTITADYSAPAAVAGVVLTNLTIHQAFEGYDIITYGTESAVLVGSAITGKTSAVYTPPVRDKRFTLATGGTQNYSFNVATTTTPPGSTTTHTVQNSVTYAGQENITVPAGTFTTCKFHTTANGSILTEWLIKGKGIEARSVSNLSTVVLGEVVKELLPSSRLNGAPILP
jgi:hypothetical protein